jgi:hypothetical protein
MARFAAVRRDGVDETVDSATEGACVVLALLAGGGRTVLALLVVDTAAEDLEATVCDRTVLALLAVE